MSPELDVSTPYVIQHEHDESSAQPRMKGKASCKRQERSPLRMRTRLAFLTLLVMALLSPAGQRAFAQTGGTLHITMSPALYPAFDPNISDYVVNSGSDASVRVTVNAPVNTRVSFDGQAFRKLSFTALIRSVTAGQSFHFVVNTGAISRTYYVRRLPSDFPTWTTERPGTPQAEYYVFAPNLKLDFSDFRHYIVVSDGYGVPLWWYRASGVVPVDAKLLPNGHMGVINFGSGEEYGLDGTLTHTFAPAGPFGGYVDNHELLLLPNGNYVYIVDVLRGPVDLSSFGGSVNATVIDNVIEEVAPDGSMVWYWSVMDHISVAETDPHWWQTYLVNSSPADPYHMNSVEQEDNAYVISCRHLNAVIRIDQVTGAIRWKLGGTPRKESLKFVGDSYGNFGGQHDARILPDDTLTLHDDGTLLGRAPRAVRYHIDLPSRTATLIEQVTDPNAPSSGCCGSARKLSGGDWVMEWGQNAAVTELAPDGSLVFRLDFQEPYFSYRAAPVPFKTIHRSDLRKGMDHQYPR